MAEEPFGATGERADLLQSLRRHRGFLRQTASGLTDEQARQRTTVSELTVGGLIKHVAATEAQWADFAVNGPAQMGDWPDDDAGSDSWDAGSDSSDTSQGWDPAAVEAFLSGFRLGPDETLAGAFAAYDDVAAQTDALVETLDLDSSHPLPTAPWFEPGAVWSARRVFLHIIAETAQHAGHADIIREGIDGQKTMG